MGWTFVAPRSGPELRDLLGRHGAAARIVAGGTWLVPRIRAGSAEPGVLVAIDRVPELRGIERRDGSLAIGALSTLRELETSGVVRAAAPALADAAGRAANVRLRHQATIGGNIVAADPAHDLPPVLVALGAHARLEGAAGDRAVPIAELFAPAGGTTLAADDLLAAIVVPAPGPGERAAFEKFRPRSVYDYATVSVAAWVRLDPEGTIADARVVAGAVGPGPVRLASVEAALRGRRADAALARSVAELAAADVDPRDDPRASAAYRRAMIVVWARRVLERVLEAGA